MACKGTSFAKTESKEFCQRRVVFMFRKRTSFQTGQQREKGDTCRESREKENLSRRQRRGEPVKEVNPILRPGPKIYIDQEKKRRFSN